MLARFVGPPHISAILNLRSMVTAPQTASSTPVSKPLNWIALLLVAVAAIVNLLRMRNGGHVGYGSWALLVALACAILSSRAEERNTRNVLAGVTILLLIVALYGMFKGGF